MVLRILGFLVLTLVIVWFIYKSLKTDFKALLTVFAVTQEALDDAKIEKRKKIITPVIVTVVFWLVSF